MTEGQGRSREPLPTSVGSLPDLPTAYDRALDTGLAALGLRLSAAARNAIRDHVRLLLAWTAAINLTSLRDPAEIATRHVIDSLAAVRLLGADDAVLDLGSGGGFPGLPLVAARPASRGLLVESVTKKARFLDAAVAATGLDGRVRVAAERAESLARSPGERGQWPVVTARAIGDLAELAELAFPLLAVGGRLIAWKRGDIRAEMEAAKPLLVSLGGGSIALTAIGVPALPEHVLAVITKRGSTPDVFPRDPGVRKRRAS
jgi:16S rRNA (guanine527-N7)-methyltransferase